MNTDPDKKRRKATVIPGAISPTQMAFRSQEFLWVFGVFNFIQGA